MEQGKIIKNKGSIKELEKYIHEQGKILLEKSFLDTNIIAHISRHNRTTSKYPPGERHAQKTGQIKMQNFIFLTYYCPITLSEVLVLQ